MTSAAPLVSLKDIAALNPTLDVTPSADDPVSFLPMSAVDPEEIAAVDSETRRYREVSKGYKPFIPNDVLVAKITPCFENGKIAQAKPTHRFGFGSTEFHVIRPHSEKLDPRYLVHFLRQERIRKEGGHKMTGSAGQRRVPEHFLANLRIPLPRLSEQRRIARILGDADALRAKRRAALAKLDALAQAEFFDLFGDPQTNPKRFPLRTLTDFYVNAKEGTRCGPFGSALKKADLVESGVPVWNMDNIDPTGRALLPFRNWIREEKYRKLKAYAVVDGDVLISRAGTVGKMCVAKSPYPASIISTNLIRVRFVPQLLPTYFVSLMTYCKGRVGRLKTGPDGALTHMNTGILDTLKFPYPPLQLQRRFAAFLKSIERQRAEQLRHGLALDTLFASLEYLAFRGKL